MKGKVWRCENRNFGRYWIKRLD